MASFEKSYLNQFLKKALMFEINSLVEVTEPVFFLAAQDISHNSVLFTEVKQYF